METQFCGNFPAIGPHSAVISPRVYLFPRSFPCNQSKFCGHLPAPYSFCRIFAVDLILLILLCYYSCNFLLPSSSFHLMCQPNLSIQSPILLHVHVICLLINSFVTAANCNGLIIKIKVQTWQDYGAIIFSLEKLKRPQADWYGAVNSKWSLCILGSGLQAEYYHQQYKNYDKI